MTLFDGHGRVVLDRITTVEGLTSHAEGYFSRHIDFLYIAAG
jgi:hypothetical protein